MNRRLEGKVAFITGAARGQGRSHALRLASEGCDIVALDLAAPLATVPYPMPGTEDLAETATSVQALGRAIIAEQADVRDRSAVERVVAQGLERFGKIDIVIANAGISPEKPEDHDPFATWDDVIDINLKGVWNTAHAALPSMIERGEGGSIVVISSVQGLSGRGGTGTAAGDAYVASKHGVVGLMRTWANWLAPHGIRVNSVQPCGVETPMVVNDALPAFFAKYPASAASLTNLLPVEVVQPEDISSAVAWLVSDEARYVTGITLPVDAGFLVK
ncbi:mycofactocin-coupled SDR family oxidoreductase [Nocardioides cavernae]|uniref:Mycofactocin-coupled SDR family oxidoreductase n=1 Tax=Nocardioides cavernae TaxID=1921566 RepID=A0ABR8N7X6_9ACTN|nr:mycofactocin-coupled SDR family oxidoreductase [Nocardioides cavernae]MBD3924248.1 mycofactocin-coupled SDR family oxidoreductase [Nocardioides cavernae]MBM7510813.1 SDR family mycofactocin-dependent oxidoreductase [Nocardioides cavernae]